ncbi:carboxypeptidase regulatory-like domain-containing protein [Flavobacterium pallidum]|uniref:Carboxypeptidase regulatory-like domain-containing protein n=1 Tax=Flavobacterium pallidum TaxID=2172098 RepID=A0A2S1SIF5_9FLAO|nr:carboxypeptidase regulatory-like domain-containing protein [Flavobacterium pallidum]AWI26127.1 hypothetical protein HYN49_09580 [Flavobacterium pallidum]
MNGKQKNKLASYIVTAAIETEADPAILAQMPDALLHLAALRAAIAKIEQASAAQLHYAQRATGNKKEARLALEEAVFNSAAALCALSTRLKDVTLAEEWNLSVNTLQKMRDHNLFATATNLVTAMQPYATQLEAYGIPKSGNTVLTDTIALFGALMPKPRENQLSEKEASLQLLEGFNDAQAAATALDTLANMLRKREPAFYADYRNRRTAIKTAARPYAATGSVTDNTGNPLRYVSVAIDGLPDTVRTTDKGNFRFQTLPDGVHILHFRLHGYQDQSHAISVNQHRSDRMAIELRES